MTDLKPTQRDVEAAQDAGARAAKSFFKKDDSYERGKADGILSERKRAQALVEAMNTCHRIIWDTHYSGDAEWVRKNIDYIVFKALEEYKRSIGEAHE